MLKSAVGLLKNLSSHLLILEHVVKINAAPFRVQWETLIVCSFQAYYRVVERENQISAANVAITVFLKLPISDCSVLLMVTESPLKDTYYT